MILGFPCAGGDVSFIVSSSGQEFNKEGDAGALVCSHAYGLDNSIEFCRVVESKASVPKSKRFSCVNRYMIYRWQVKRSMMGWVRLRLPVLSRGAKRLGSRNGQHFSEKSNFVHQP
jgi:rRNA maturation protein Nop10